MRNYRLILVVLGVLFLAVRIFRLDADVPYERMFMVSPVDEAYYVPGAMNLNLYGAYTNTTMPGADRDASTLLFSNSMVTAFTMFTAGNNYFGLRLSSVIMSFIVLLFFILLRARYNEGGSTDTTSRLITLILIGVLIFDPAFLLMSRVQDPVLFRAAWLSGIVLLVFEWLRRGQIYPFAFSFCLGALCVLSVLIGYVHNAFICAAAGSFVFVLPLAERKIGKSIGQSTLFILGAIVGVGVFAILNSILTGVSLSEMMTFIGSASDGRMQGDRLGLIQRFTGAFVQTLSTGIFRLNPAVLFLFIISSAFLIRNSLKRKDPADIFLLLLFAWVFVQAFFENTYPEKRHTMLLPLVLLLIGKMVGSALKDKAAVSKPWMISIGIIAMGVTLYVLRGYYLMVMPYFPGSQYLLYTGALSLLAISVILYMWISGTLKSFGTIAISGFFLIATGVFFWMSTTVLNPGFTYRDGMKKIALITEDGVIAGGLGIGFHTYSAGKCGINSYAWYHDYPQYVGHIERIVSESPVPVYTVLYPEQKQNSHVRTINAIHKADFFEVQNARIKTDTLEAINLSDRSILVLRLRKED